MGFSLRNEKRERKRKENARAHGGVEMVKSERRTFLAPEFLLIVVMLLVLLLLVLIIMLAPLPNATDAVEIELAMEYRQNLLALIITAFGAWVGAGAAYYFGRENLETAAQSLLQMRGPTPQERLRQTPISQVPPRPIDWVVSTDTTIKDVIEKLKKEPIRWFIPITEKDAFKTVINEEVIYRFIQEKAEKDKEDWNKIKDHKVSDALTFLDSDKSLKERCSDIYVSAKLDDSAAQINEEMEKKNLTLAIITDEKAKPIQYITTADIRRVLLRT